MLFWRWYILFFNNFEVFMKKLFVLLALTVSMALFLSSCGDDDTATGPSSLKLGEMSATVNGSGWKAQNAIFFNTVIKLSL
jgi:hypothetical protein